MGFKDDLSGMTTEDIINETFGEPVEETLKSVQDSTDSTDKTDDTEQAEVEQAIESTETEQTADDGQGAEYRPQFAEVAQEYAAAPAVAAVTKKKKGVLQTSIIVSICLVVGALLAFLVYKFVFLNSVVGTWEVKGSDGTVYYYTFEEDNKVTMRIGTIEFVGEYTASDTKDGKALTINQYYGEISGDYTYTITGVKLFGNQVMTLTSGETAYTFNQAKIKTDYLEKPTDFKADEKLLGEWKYLFEDYGITYTFTFNDDGTMVINQYDAIIYNCVYTIEDSKIKCHFYTTEDTEQEIEYSFKGDKLIIMGLECSRPGTSTADQAASE